MMIGYFMDQIANEAWIKHARMIFSLHEVPHTTQRLLNVEEGEGSLPPSLFEGNSGMYTTQCVLDRQLPKYVGNNTVRYCLVHTELDFSCR